jgi:hypothetical protein
MTPMGPVIQAGDRLKRWVVWVNAGERDMCCQRCRTENPLTRVSRSGAGA